MKTIVIFHIAASAGMPHPSWPRRRRYQSAANVSLPSSRRTGPSSAAVESSGPLVAVIVPLVALLPLVVIMVHSVALLPLAAVVPPVAVVYRPSPLSCRPSKLIVESSGVALLSLSLSPLVRHRPPPSYRAAAASLLIVAPPLPSLSCRWFCFRRCATAAFLEAMSAVYDCCVTPKFAMIFCQL